jgi:hypothetical protein
MCPHYIENPGWLVKKLRMALKRVELTLLPGRGVQGPPSQLDLVRLTSTALDNDPLIFSDVRM